VVNSGLAVVRATECGREVDEGGREVWEGCG
jgi:hypothetical protein